MSNLHSKLKISCETPFINLGSVHEHAIDVPGTYPLLKTVGEPSSGKSAIDGPVSGMMKFATRPQPKAIISTNRDSNVPSKFVNPAFERDIDDEFGSMDRLDDHEEEKPKSFSKWPSLIIQKYNKYQISNILFIFNP